MAQRRKILSNEEIKRRNSVIEEYLKDWTLGRIIVQLKDAAGRSAPRVGWVYNEHPRLMILFEDGVLCDVPSDLWLACEPCDRWDDIDEICTIMNDMAKSRSVKRKETYR